MKPLHAKFLLLFLILISCNNNKIENLDLIPVRNGSNFQYINLKGEIIINPQFSNASVFRNNIALVRTCGENPKWGFINSAGKYLINPEYKSATIFSDGIAFVVSENGFPIAINEKGDLLFSLKEVKRVRLFKNHLAAYTKQDTIEKWGFINENGKIAIPENFYEVSNFSEEKCAVKDKNNKWGYIDANGKTIISFQFDEASDFTENTAIVYNNGKAGVINKDGQYCIETKFTTLYKDGELFLFEQDKKWGWCNEKGKIIIKPQFEIASKFNDNDIASVKIGKQYGYINKEGVIVITPQFDLATVFNNNLAMIEKKGEIGFVNKKGNYIINPQYDGYSFDYLSYVNTGNSLFSEIETDFFDIDKLIEKINLNSPEGLSFQNTIAQIIQKFKLDISKLDTSQEEITLYSNKEIIANGRMSFQIIVPYSKSISTFNPNNKPEGFVYQINLSGRASGKSDAILKQLHLEKYQKVKSGFIQGNQYMPSSHNLLLIYK